MILTVYAIDNFFNFENKHTRTHAGDNLQYNISTEWNILKSAHDFLKCMLFPAYPTIVLELKSKIFFGMNGHKEQFYFSKVCSK